MRGIVKRRAYTVRGGAVLAMLLVAGCSVFKKEVPPPCPRVSVLSDAGKLVRYRDGPGRDITDVLFEAGIVKFVGNCAYRDKNTRVTIELSVVFDLRRGPANRDRKAGFEYFVAIPSVHPAPEGKRRLPIRVEFPGNRTRSRVTDVLELEIPIAKGSKGTDYPVFIGFQLSVGELRENRARSGG